jgi:hypothetical protein
MTSKKLVNEGKDQLKETLEVAFDVFYKGLTLK